MDNTTGAAVWYNVDHVRPKYFSLIYSERQLEICRRTEHDFTPNTYMGRGYTEMKTGQTPQECASNFDNATVVFSGEIHEYDLACEKGHIKYR